MKPIWALRSLRWSYVAFIAAASSVAVAAGAHGTGEGRHHASLVLALAIPECIAALAFLLERFEVAACAVLVAIYMIATGLSLEAGDFLAVLRFVFFGVSAVYIVQAHRGLTARAD